MVESLEQAVNTCNTTTYTRVSIITEIISNIVTTGYIKEKLHHLKDGASFCYCAYVPSIVVTHIFLYGFQ